MAPWWIAARGAAMEVGWAAVRVAGIPAAVTAGGVQQLTGHLGRLMPWLPVGGAESPPQQPGVPVLLVHGLAERAIGCRTRFVALYSDLDEAVIPTHAGRIDHPDLDARNILVHGIGHLALPHHKRVISEIRTALTEVVDTASAGAWEADAMDRT